MSIDHRLLDILCCPVSKRPLRHLSGTELAFLNAAIAEGTVKDVAGVAVQHALAAALITDDLKVIYRIDDGIPVLLPEDGIGTTQFQDFPRQR